jgi:peptidoglycan/xylan/chitin deacetylase (PgdA/CDA1 family)
VVTLGWQHYTYAGRDLSLPNPLTNSMPSGSFTDFASNGVPSGWSVTSSGSSQFETGQGKGYTGNTAFKTTVSHYQNGNVTITTPKVTVQPNTTYLFKGYYTASMPFSLLARYYYADGSDSLNFVQSYPGASGSWSTASDAFRTATNITAVQFMYTISSNGELDLDSLYLEPRDHVYIPLALAASSTIPNGNLQPGNYNMPAGWTTYHTGNSTANFSYTPDTASVKVQVSNYKSGQAKWQYPTQPVQPHQYYQFSIDYQSTVPVPIIAEYGLPDGRHLDQTLATLQPTGELTTFTHPLEVPPGAISLFISAPLQKSGVLTTRNYALTNITKPGAEHWQQPIVSITFDDGWQSVYDNALPALERYKYAATFYVNPSAIETPGFMTAAELNRLADAGDEIAAHGYSHDDMTAINTRALDYELRQGRDYLRAAGFTVTDLATPYGRNDPELQWYARQYYETVRGTEIGINTRQNIDPYNLKVLSITEDTDSKAIAAALQHVKEENGWLILVYHRVGDERLLSAPKAESSTTTIGNFTKQIALVHRSGIAVLPVAAAYKELQR